uniref:Uncharacterized protein n=1 Tax=Anguilla anguilla TaxID=7936 RepID=A0A0E9QGX3_ANGAN
MYWSKWMAHQRAITLRDQYRRRNSMDNVVN